MASLILLGGVLRKSSKRAKSSSLSLFLNFASTSSKATTLFPLQTMRFIYYLTAILKDSLTLVSTTESIYNY